jgi:hypothetical protein
VLPGAVLDHKTIRVERAHEQRELLIQHAQVPQVQLRPSHLQQLRR